MLQASLSSMLFAIDDATVSLIHRDTLILTIMLQIPSLPQCIVGQMDADHSKRTPPKGHRSFRQKASNLASLSPSVPPNGS